MSDLNVNIEKKPTSGLAIAGLVLGILAIVTSLIPIINNGSFILALIGLVLGVVGLIGIRKGTKGGKGIAIAAIVLTIVSIVLVLISQQVYSAAIDKALDNSMSEANSASSTDETSASADAVAAADKTSSKYQVSIDNAMVTTDYNGDKAIVVTYSWTNNSDDTTSAMVALSEKAFQDGVQLETAFVNDLDNDGHMADVRPGAGTTYQVAYSLKSDSDVEVEVAELFSFSKEKIATATFSVA